MECTATARSALLRDTFVILKFDTLNFQFLKSLWLLNAFQSQLVLLSI
ncbi:hypothetical protein MCERH10_02512 [Caulobacteraceae bacterium]